VLEMKARAVRDLYVRLRDRGLVPRRKEADAMAAAEDRAPFDTCGWKEIAAYLNVDERTAQRWQADGLPTHDFQGSVVALRSELRAWQAARMKPRAVAK
jgi:hypothetical protein